MTDSMEREVRVGGVERFAVLVPAEVREGADSGEGDGGAAGPDRDERVWLFSSQFDGDGEWIDVEVCDGPGGWSVEVGHVRAGDDGVSVLVGSPRRIVVQRGSALGPELVDAEPVDLLDPDDVANLRRDLIEANTQVVDLCNALARIACRHGMPPEVTPEDIADCAIEAADAYGERAYEVVRTCGGEPGVDGWREALARVVKERNRATAIVEAAAHSDRVVLGKLYDSLDPADREPLWDAADRLRRERDEATEQHYRCQQELEAARAMLTEADCALVAVADVLGIALDSTPTQIAETMAARAGVVAQAAAALPRCSDCGHQWTVVGGVTQDGLGWVEGTAAHECDGIGSLATFARDADGQLVTRDTFDVEEVGRLRDVIERLEQEGGGGHAPAPTLTREERAQALENLKALNIEFEPDPPACVRCGGSGEEPTATPIQPPRPVPPYDELDAGIRETVRWLFDHGFDPTDSGDGVSKFTDPSNRYHGLAGALDEPHVFMRVASPAALAAEADRLHVLLEERGVDIPGSLEASYVPDEPAVLALLGVDDRVLFGAGEGGAEPRETPELGPKSSVDSPLPGGACDDGDPCTADTCIAPPGRDPAPQAFDASTRSPASLLDVAPGCPKACDDGDQCTDAPIGAGDGHP